MNERDFRALVRKMILTQKKYFQNRLQSDLIAAKQLEKQVWEELEAGPDQPAEPTQASLFGDDNGTQTEVQDH